MNTWKDLIEYINKQDSNCVFSPQDAKEHINIFATCINNYFRTLVLFGSLKRIGQGRYKKIYNISENISYTKIYDIAYNPLLLRKYKILEIKNKIKNELEK